MMIITILIIVETEQLALATSTEQLAHTVGHVFEIKNAFPDLCVLIVYGGKVNEVDSTQKKTKIIYFDRYPHHDVHLTFTFDIYI